jgi:large subunit ribosomal protein L23
LSIAKYYDVILSPLVSEKSTMIGEKYNQYVFKVSRSASKFDIKKAVEIFFKVKVDSVQVMNVKGKKKRYGSQVGRRNHEKKAYISLAEGQEISLGTGD